MPLENKTAITTGSMRRSGRQLAVEGANILLNPLGREQEIAAAFDAIRAYALQAHNCNANLSDLSQIVAPFGTAQSNQGTITNIDTKVRNGTRGAIEDLAPRERHRIMAINMYSAFHSSRAACPDVQPRGRGGILISLRRALEESTGISLPVDEGRATTCR